ncbi:ABC transporter substrate-binding protein [Nitratireductor soli]|uniref:ABC transporter substrate-binding protein n=1 Tax=Nitratireductor soli TaxID=1670619 RepID=UPI0009E2B71B|nr:ABC transporter substrate-binding protein [Nitratireductor soli]
MHNRGRRPRIVVAAAALAAFVAGPAGAAEEISFNMAWLPQGSVAGPIIAEAKGWFDEAGLDVTLSRGYGGSRTANEVDQGMFTIGYVDPINVALNRQNGGSLRMIGVINGVWPAGVCYVKKESGDQRDIDGIIGLKMGGGAASPVHNILPAWLEMNGRERDAISLLRLEPAVVDASLLEGRIDLAECWRASNRAVLQKIARDAGKEVGWIEYSDHGLDAYGSGFVATEASIAEKPEALSAFLEASYRGYEFAMAEPDAAADILVAAYPSLDREITLQQIKELASLLSPSGTIETTFDADRIGATHDLMVKAFDLKPEAVKPDQLFTNALAK